MSAPSSEEFTETDVDNFIGFVSFLAKNNLWEETKEALQTAGVTTIRLSAEPIRVIRKMIEDEWLTSGRLGPSGHRHALVIAECGCGVSSPGPPGHGPAFPTGGGDAGAGDAGNLPQ